MGDHKSEMDASALRRKLVYTSSDDYSGPPRESVEPAPPATIASLQKGAPVRVARARKGRGGKTVSVISGVTGPTAGRETLLKLLKNRLGAGGALEDDDLIIQGDHRQRIVEILNELGYRAKAAGG